MEAQSNKDERIELRVSAADKRIFKRAQKLSGDKSFSSFVVRIVKKEAEEIVAQQDRILASEKDRQLFFDTVFSHTKPNESLIAAAKRYKSKNS
ncbi:type II toxin-antitoxin system TacA family antitoxin [Algoriphagus namhaensis]